jgi:hypothetical protein
MEFGRSRLRTCIALGCRHSLRGRTAPQLERHADELARLEPPARELRRGGSRVTRRVLDAMLDVEYRADEIEMAPAKRERIEARLTDTARRFVLSAASRAATAELAYSLLERQLAGDDAAIGEAARRYARARAAERQAMFERDGSYRDPVPEAIGRRVGRAVAAVGSRVRRRPSTPPFLRAANCVFSRRRFAPEGERAPNPDLAYHFLGTEPIHVRCYTNVDPSELFGGGAQLIVRVPRRFSDYTAAVAAPEQLPPGRMHVDVVLPGAPDGAPWISAGERAANVEVTLEYEWMEKLAPWTRGKQQRRYRVLSRSCFLWERAD